MKNLTNIVINCLLIGFLSPIYAQSNQHGKQRLEAEKFINNTSAKLITNGKLSQNLGVSHIGNDTDKPTLTIPVQTQKNALFVLESHAITDEYGTNLMAKAKTKFESLFMEIQIDNQPKTRRVVSVPWNVPTQELGKFRLDGKSVIKIWLPKGVILDYIELHPYKEPNVPQEVKHYKPSIIPKGHPRLWVTNETLPAIIKNLSHPENLDRWNKVKALALQNISLPNYNGEVQFDESLEKAIEAKAFYYLLTKDKKIGYEALALTKQYISHVSFGNLLDITREIGRTIHISSEVYDWCYDLLKNEDKQLLIMHLKRLAIDMEIGWPPFLQPVVNGHGAEAQINRDLLSMAIAIYDEDPIPYQYCAYRILEELVPMRKFEYQSPRHNQGINYGAYRMNWDLHAAWLFKRMSGQDVFDENIKNTADYWIYFRLPDGQMLRDGDHALRSKAGIYDYWQINPTFTFMHYTYSDNPYLKYSFGRMNTSSVNPILYLLLNNPDLPAQPIPSTYPLSKDFGPILGGMVNRTGWDDDIKSNNVIAEIKGGGYFFSNHQHNDAGAIQIYYRGFQVGDLGQYKFYGTPYDLNFTKRSVAHSMMLAVDPTEKIGSIPSNDGGTRMFRKVPNSPAEMLENKSYLNGKVISSSPSDSFSYFSTDLTSAYSDKISYYQRDYVFVNTNQDEIPAIILLKDRMETKSPEIKKYWQINTINTPLINDKYITLQSSREGLSAYTHVQFIYPSITEMQSSILAKDEAHNIFGYQVYPPDSLQYESHGHRILMSPIKANNKDGFLSIFQLSSKDKPLVNPIYYKTAGYDYIQLMNRLILMNDSEHEVTQIPIIIKENREIDVFITGIKAGNWILKNNKGKVIQRIRVEEHKNTTSIKLHKGSYKLVYM